MVGKSDENDLRSGYSHQNLVINKGGGVLFSTLFLGYAKRKKVVSLWGKRADKTKVRAVNSHT